MSLSRRAEDLQQSPSSIVEGSILCASNPYSSKNPAGYLNFGVAENHLMNELLLKKLNQPISVTEEHIHYDNIFGSESFKKISADFLENHLGIKKIVPENLVTQAGVSAICEALSFALFDEGDYIMIPTPYYTGFEHDFTKRFKTIFLKNHLKPAENFKHDIQIFKQTYQDFPHKKKVKAILLTGPHNPTGEVLEKSFMLEIIEFAKKNDLHIISDEIYALSQHQARPHQSLYQLAVDNGAKAHLLYGLAKDFAIAGFKVGYFYSTDREITKAMQDLTYFHPISTYTQEIVSLMLKDETFINNFIQLNCARLNKTKGELINSLTRFKFIPSQAGLFVLLDLSSWCHNFADEDIIYEHLLKKHKIHFSKGSDLGMNIPGYFRVCFARPVEQIKELCLRLYQLKRPTHE